MKTSLINKFLIFIAAICMKACITGEPPVTAPQWEEVTLSFSSTDTYDNPYMDVDLMAEFTHTDGTVIVRPAFWNGNNVWKVRFSSPLAEGNWIYLTRCSNEADEGLHGRSGTLNCVPYEGNDPLISRGLLRMSPGKRNVVHASGRPFLMVADTPWALPFRGTEETVSIYARDRQQKGFNAALLMTLQPDRDASGPRDRLARDGFDVAFEDLPDGHIKQMNIGYFQQLDKLVDILLDHGIVPVFQPVFHGFGWKGKNVLGWNMVPEEYARYCRYLVARYGARHAFWLVGGDGNGMNPGVKEGGEEIEKWDAYLQPTGIHYNPFDDYCPDYMQEQNCFHDNKSYQAEPWLDFQWCQTGHDGKHLPHKIMQMYENEPVKAVANGEPTYEAMNQADRAAGWWQGHEAWLQFTSGGTMGVVYGAAGLWQWKLFTDEEWPRWADGQGMSWKEALALEGSDYVGAFGKILDGFDITDIERRHDMAGGGLLLAKPGKLYIAYLPNGGKVSIPGVTQNISYAWFNPKTGKRENPLMTLGENFITPTDDPWVMIIGEKRY